MNRRGEISDRTADILISIYLFFAGIFTLKGLQNSIVTDLSGTIFLIASVYFTVSVFKNQEESL